MKFWGLVPAAGVGRRMGAEVPKQYLSLKGRPVIEHSLQRLVDHPAIESVLVAIASDDRWWRKCSFVEHNRVTRVQGGAERCHSVLAMLDYLDRQASAEDWVLVHDAARPCLRSTDIDLMIERLSKHPVGGLLGLPVRDTVKKAGQDGRVEETVLRDGLWLAFTPQMFRLGMLRRALREALDRTIIVTDDSAAMELAGHKPVLIEGRADNIKITRPEDLDLARYYLERE